VTGSNPRQVLWHDSVTSTMDVAAALMLEGAEHGVVVAAREQTAGRGRRGATWISPPGAGLYFSFIARPRDPRSIQLITLAAGVGVRDGVVTATGLAPDLKWPNDLLVGRRKLAGILAEGHQLGSSDAAVVIGAGINVQPAAYPPEVAARATSLEGELGRVVDAELLLAAILMGLDGRLASLAQNPGDILQAWRAASPSANGTRVEWDGRHGVTSGIDDTGALLIRTSANVERLIAGDIHWNL
jgi:BirA family transcriptional regulator, biotin operon repressor / biotin---[acetyl-CoA-carboxylase] ligase